MKMFHIFRLALKARRYLTLNLKRYRQISCFFFQSKMKENIVYIFKIFEILYPETGTKPGSLPSPALD